MNVGGLNDNIKAMANEFGGEDYVVLAADLFHVKIATDPSRVRELTSSVTDNPEFLPSSASKI
jgi:dienelactone hydrolase